MNSPGTGVGGADESVLQNLTLGMTIFGFPHQRPAGDRVADDFTVTGNGWQIDWITFFAYQTFSDTNSTIDHVNYRIWDGPPNDPNSAIVFGDTTTNRLLTSSWSHIYRVSESTSGTDTDRPVMINVVNADLFLSPGTYWLDWQAGGTLSSGPWAPPITITGEANTGNALQYIGSWSSVTDIGPQGFPFTIEGAAAGDFIRLLPPTSGVIASGKGAEIVVHLVGTYPDTILRATIQFTTNDPENPVVVVPVSLSVGATVGVRGGESLPSTFELSQNYPNPFNPSTIVRYGLPYAGYVKLELFNILGEQVAVLVDGEKEAGYHEVILSNSDLASGMYLYRIQMRQRHGGGSWFVETRKLVLVK